MATRAGAREGPGRGASSPEPPRKAAQDGRPLPRPGGHDSTPLERCRGPNEGEAGPRSGPTGPAHGGSRAAHAADRRRFEHQREPETAGPGRAPPAGGRGPPFGGGGGETGGAATEGGDHRFRRDDKGPRHQASAQTCRKRPSRLAGDLGDAASREDRRRSDERKREAMAEGRPRAWTSESEATSASGRERQRPPPRRERSDVRQEAASYSEPPTFGKCERPG